MTKNNNKSVLVALLLAPLLTAGFTVGNIPQAEAGALIVIPFDVSSECENTSPNTILWTFLITNMGDADSSFDFHIVLETSDEVFFDEGSNVLVDNEEPGEITILSAEGPSVYTGTFTVTNQLGVEHSATATCEIGAEGPIQDIIEDVDALNDPDLNNGNINSLNKKLENAIMNITNEDPTDDAEACEKLQSFINQLNAFVNSGKLDQGQVAPLIDAAQSLIDDLCTPG